MLPTHLLPHTVTVQTPGTTTDRYGNTVQDWSSPATRTILGRFEMLVSDAVAVRETTQGRDDSRSVWRFYCNDEIGMTERLAWNGLVFDIDGEVSPVYGALALDHYEALARTR